MERKNIDLSLIIPALNESAIIVDTLSQIKDYLQKNLQTVNYEVIVVAAQDKDNTAELAKKSASMYKPNQLIVVSPPNRVGKGRDVALGFGAAKGKVQIFTDADLALPLGNIKKMYDLLLVETAAGNDAAVFGVRSQKHANLLRRIISFCSSIITRILFTTNITDLQCGIKGFTAGAAKVGFKNLQTTGWTFDVELFAKLQKAKITIIPLKIDVWQNDTHHLGGENLAKAAIVSFIEMLKIRVRTLF